MHLYRAECEDLPFYRVIKKHLYRAEDKNLYFYRVIKKHLYRSENEDLPFYSDETGSFMVDSTKAGEKLLSLVMGK